MFLSIARMLFLISVLIAIFSRSTDFQGTISDRFLPCDAVAVASAVVYVFARLLGGSLSIVAPSVLNRAFILVVVGFGPGLIVSANPAVTLVEVVVHVFLVVTCILAVNLFASEKGFLSLRDTFVATGVIAAMLGIIQVVGGSSFSVIGFQVGGDVNDGSAVGGFRNTGQAGTYAYTVFMASICSAYAEFNTKGRTRRGMLFMVASAVIGGYVFMTGKIAASVGTVISCIGLAVVTGAHGRVKALVGLSVSIVIGGFGFIYMLSTNENLASFLTFRTQSRISTVPDEGGFVATNFRAAWSSFLNDPFFGSGIGGFQGVFDTHEVHSTYLKMLGETGFVGLVLYGFFMFGLLRTTWRSSKLGGYYGAFLTAMGPVMIGAMVSWGYTYHLRKREFWVVVALILIASILARREYERKVHRETI